MERATTTCEPYLQDAKPCLRSPTCQLRPSMPAEVVNNFKYHKPTLYSSLSCGLGQGRLKSSTVSYSMPCFGLIGKHCMRQW